MIPLGTLVLTRNSPEEVTSSQPKALPDNGLEQELQTMLLSFSVWLDKRMGVKSPGGIAALLRGFAG